MIKKLCKMLTQDTVLRARWNWDVHISMNGEISHRQPSSTQTFYARMLIISTVIFTRVSTLLLHFKLEKSMETVSLVYLGELKRLSENVCRSCFLTDPPKMYPITPHISTRACNKDD